MIKNWPIYAVLLFSKMAAAAILDLLFVDFGPPTMSQLLGSMLPAKNYDVIILTQKECSSRGTTHFDISRVKIGSAVSPVGLSK